MCRAGTGKFLRAAHAGAVARPMGSRAIGRGFVPHYPGAGDVASPGITRGRRSAERRVLVASAAGASRRERGSFAAGAPASGRRVAFRRSTAAILGLGTVLPGPDRGHAPALIPQAFARV